MREPMGNLSNLERVGEVFFVVAVDGGGDVERVRGEGAGGWVVSKERETGVGEEEGGAVDILV